MASKLRILCFHGYLQNSHSFKLRIASIYRYVKKVAEFGIIEIFRLY